MNARKQGLSQSVSSAIAEISERTGQRIDSDSHRPNRAAVRTMPQPKDPLSAVWASELEPMLRAELRLKSMTLFEYLEDRYPGKYPRVLRTLQRRVSDWKALHGPSPEVMFTLRHEPGVMGLSDFTTLKGMQVTIGGEVFEHLIYHYRLTYSGWQYAQIIQGGESFVGLSEGLQNAFPTLQASICLKEISTHYTPTQPMAQTTLFVCSSCRFSVNEANRNGISGGKHLIEQLHQALIAQNLQDTIRLEPVRCMAGCRQPCNVSLAAPGKLTFILSQVSPTQGAASISVFCQQYIAC